VGVRDRRLATPARGEDGEPNPDSEIAAEAVANVGAYIMGRRMFGGGDGAWDPAWRGWWGEDPPFHVPVFVLTHHLREPLPLQGGTTFTFVTDGAPGLDRQPVVASRPAGSATSSGCRTSIQRALCEPRASHKARLRSNWGSRLAAGRTEERRPVTPSPEARSGEVDETKLGSSPKRILVEA
jgi:hypothetical protein